MKLRTIVAGRQLRDDEVQSMSRFALCRDKRRAAFRVLPANLAYLKKIEDSDGTLCCA